MSEKKKLYALFSPSGKRISGLEVSDSFGAALWNTENYLAERFMWAADLFRSDVKGFHAERRRRGWVIHEIAWTKGRAAE